MRKNKNGNDRSDELRTSKRIAGIGWREPSADAPPSSAAVPSAELQQFRRGEMTEDQYLEARIAQATLHLRGRVSARKLERIRTTLQRICASDPVLLAMKERILRAKAKAGGG